MPGNRRRRRGPSVLRRPGERDVVVPLEEAEQIRLVAWAENARDTYPELELLHAVPNGGSRHPAEAARLRAAGVRPGVSDLCLPVARGGWHGVYIELKRNVFGEGTKWGTLSDEQRRWLVLVDREGYLGRVCRGADEARSLIEAYLSDGPANDIGLGPDQIA